MHAEATPSIPRPRPARGFDPDVEVAMAGRTLGLLYLAGALIGALSMVLPHSRAANDGVLWANITLAFLTGLSLLALGRRVRGWMFHLALAAGTPVIFRAIWYSGESVSFYSIWFIWVGLVAFYFLRRRVAAGYVAFASLMYALNLIHQPGSAPIARWLTTVTTLVVAGVLISALVSRARRQTDRMVRVADMAHALARLSDPDAARPALCETAVRLTGADGVALLERDGESGRVEVSALAGAAPTQPGPLALRAFSAGEAVASEACLWQPVTRDGEVAAVLAFRWADARDHDAELLGLLAVETSVTLERLEALRRLERSARTDELTGLPNRRAWQEALARELARAGRAGAPLCVAMLDIDHFKRFNDEHGHLAGDVLLQEAAAAWGARLRPSDLLARYGGEEFTLAMPGCTEGEATRLVQRLRAAMPADQTCSAGIARWDGRESAAALLDRADRALYRAKELGRDRVMSAA